MPITNLKSILLVEDNPDEEALALRALRQSELPNLVVVARDGAEAVQHLLGPAGFENIPGKLPALVLMDLNLPRLSGFEVLEKIRADERTKGLPVVILTSSDREEDVERAYCLGANSFIRKPMDFDEFTDCVRQLGMYWLSINRTKST